MITKKGLMTSLIKFNDLEVNTTYYLHYGLIRGVHLPVYSCIFKVLERKSDCYVVDFGEGKIKDLIRGWVFKIS